MKKLARRPPQSVPVRRQRQKRASSTLKVPQDWLYQALAGGSGTASGVSVSETTALNLSVVWACVRVISETIGSLPWFVYERGPEGGRERAESHEAYSLLHDMPNPDMTAMSWKETTVAHCVTWGNAYSEIVRDGGDRIAALFPITPDRVTVRRRDDGRIVYEVSNGGNSPTILQSDQIFHVPGLGYDGLVGYSVIHKARESMGMAMAAEKFGSALYGNMARPGGALKVPNALSEKARANLKKSMEAFTGSANAGKFLLLDEGLTWESMSIQPEDAQFIESRQFQVEEICRWFRVQPHKVQHLLRSTFSNIEHQSIEFVVDTIRPWLVRLEQEANRKLIRPTEKKRFYTEHLVDALLRGDALSRSQALEVQFRNGVLLGDEWRAIENRNPLPNGLGKRPMGTVNTVPLDKLDEVLEAKNAKPEPSSNDNSASEEVKRHIEGVRERMGDVAADREGRRLATLIRSNLEGN